MTTGSICCRVVHLASGDESVENAAIRMREQNVGTLFILDPKKRPRGIITDRDIVVRVAAEGRDPRTTPVSAVMTRDVATVREHTPIEDALAEMAAYSVRRLAVLNAAGSLVGVLALDDVLDLLAEESVTIGRILKARPHRAAHPDQERVLSG